MSIIKDEVIAALTCEAEWESLWKFFNWFASGKSQEQWSRVDPQAVLGDLYVRLAIIYEKQKQALQEIGA